MPQSNSQAYKFAPVENDEKRVELSLDGDLTVIKLSSWVDGLGWCGEKTLKVDPELLDDMHRMLRAARVRLRQRKSQDTENNPAAHRVLSFPAGA